MVKYSITLLCGVMFLSSAASDKPKFWVNPAKKHQKFLKQLDMLPKYVESENAEEALKSLSEVLRMWTKGKTLIYPKGYGEARTKISALFDSYLRNQNENATKIMMHNIVRYHYFGGLLYSPLKVLQDEKSQSFEKANALWLMKVLPDYDVESEFILADTKTLNGALKYMPLDIRSAMFNIATYGARDCSTPESKASATYDQKCACDQLCQNVELMRNYNEPLDAEFDKFLVQREICMTEDAAEERRQARLQTKIEQLRSEALATSEMV